jgi:uncharacterized protein YabE (DUF348 family)
MKIKFTSSTLRYIAIGAIVVGVVLLAISARKEVVVDLDGKRIILTTSALRVSGALRSAEIEFGGDDLIIPPKNSLAKEGQVISVRRSVMINIISGDNVRQIYSTERIPANWLEEAGIQLFPGDQILISGQIFPPGQEVSYSPVYTIEVKKAVDINVQVGEHMWTIYSGASTVGQALWEAGFSLREADRVFPPMETKLNGPLVIHVFPADALMIFVDGEVIASQSAAENVGEALAQAGLSLQGMDYSQPAEDQPLPEDGMIRVVRVVEEVVLEQETIPFEYKWELTNELEIDQVQTTQYGEFGLKAKRVRVRYEDGVEVGRTVEAEWVAKEPVAQIEGYGTQIVVRTLDTPSGTIQYWRAVDMYATSYSPCRSAGEEGRCYPYTSLGDKVQIGVVAVIYDWWLLMAHHTVYIPGYGHAVISDVGGGIPGKPWIDLGYSDDDWVSWSQWVTVYFTLPIPPADEIIYILPTK